MLDVVNIINYIVRKYNHSKNCNYVACLTVVFLKTLLTVVSIIKIMIKRSCNKFCRGCLAQLESSYVNDK